ncbi:PD-(D/E)XK nuclease family protein [Myroides marinus]|uniref:PDDEXK-like family protein n=1 Tax=Myroides marinus TaxID=703342 RepID=UPI0025761266|nr:PD-(D/E)XK nuclease family protein [Myroides marinus]MDM1363194.1 PD-(D/E)XK nuclease family protein [Myroides marinus]MDM1372736.1 PD-(D/E)XK nuclease family protein [Myroides marinus]
MDSDKQLNAFFEQVKLGMKFAKDYEAKHKNLLAKNFNTMDFVRWDENKVSEIIGFLLDPKGVHDQGSVYLDLFFKQFVSKIKFTDREAVTVILEDRTFEDRRIDIVLSYKNYQKVIGIENKINLYTKDQKNQVADYMRFLEEIVKDKQVEKDSYMLFYLTPKGRELSEDSANKGEAEQWKEEGRLVCINYEDHIIPFLEDCIKETSNERVRYFITDFRKQLIENYMGKEGVDQSMIINQLANTENIEVAFAIQNTLPHFKQEVKERLNIQMQELAEELTEELQQEIKYVKEHHHFEIPQLKNTYVKYSYEMNGVIYGLVKQPDYFNNVNSEKIIIEGLSNVLGIKFKTSPWWPCYAFEYENIEVVAEFWSDAQSGKFKEFMRNFIYKVVRLDEAFLEQL